jgi:hypothetical protein
MKMQKLYSVFAFVFLLISGTALSGQSSKPDERRSVGKELEVWVSNVEKELVPAADAMPEDKYAFAPTNGEFEGVRTFAEQIKHLAATQYILASAVLGEKPPHGERERVRAGFN